MINIGFHYNCSMKTDPRRRLSASLINRVALIDAGLRESGCRLLFYSPKHIRSLDRDVPGYLFTDNAFVPTRQSIPTINGNWTYNTRKLMEKGMGYRAFSSWAAANGVGVYVPHAFSELINNKLETYKLIRGYHPSLHPHCESYRHESKQLEHFVDASRLTFIKPRTGNQGERIITVTRDRKGLSITRYLGGERKRFRATTIRAAKEFIRRLTPERKKFVIQHGIETMRHDDSVFDIRVVMLHDGNRWTWLNEVRLSPEGSDVSNVRQGGDFVATEQLLYDLLGDEGSQQMIYKLESESFGLAAYLDRLHPGEIPEIAFDFALDRDGSLKLLEINTKPGLAGIGSEVSVFDKEPGHEAMFEKWVYPHTSRLAQFLASKLDRNDR